MAFLHPQLNWEHHLCITSGKWLVYLENPGPFFKFDFVRFEKSSHF